MSYCPEFSYWLAAEPMIKDTGISAKDCEELLNALNTSALARPEGPMVFEIQEGAVKGEVDPDEGTTPRDGDLAKCIMAVSAAFPKYQFVFDEYNEENAADKKRTVFASGAVVSESYARTLYPEELDQATLNAVVHLIQDRLTELRKESANAIALIDNDAVKAIAYAEKVCQELRDGVSRMH